MITVYGRDNCPHCVQAKYLLEEGEYPFEYRNVVSDIEAFADLREKAPEARSVPQIFIGDEHIGGFMDLKKALTADSNFIWNKINEGSAK